jgi:cysteine synthase A
MIAESILDVIGKTPMVFLKKLSELNIFAKAEYLNPGGDRQIY